MNRRFRQLFLLAVAVLPAHMAFAETYVIDGRHTFPSFEISHIGFSTQRGRFNQTEGKITLDAKGRHGTINVRIDANSVDTGLEELEARLKKEDFFDTVRHPAITFASEQMEFSGETPVAATGVLTLLGVSKPLRLDITHFHCGVHPISQRQVCGADASGKIRRSDFGMKAFLPAIGDEVTLKIQIEAFRD